MSKCVIHELNTGLECVAAIFPLLPIRRGSIRPGTLLITVWGSRVSLRHVRVPVSACTKYSLLALVCHSIPEKTHPCSADQKLGLGEGVVPVCGGLTVNEGQSQGFVPGVSTSKV